MRGAWTFFLLSLLSLITGLCLVMLFTLLYVIPSMNLKASIPTHCYVEEIVLQSTGHQQGRLPLPLSPHEQPHHQPFVTLSNAVVSNSTGTIISRHLQTAGDDYRSDMLCHVVHVSFSLHFDHTREGYLHQKAFFTEESSRYHPSTRDVSSMCPGVGQFYGIWLYVGNYPKKKYRFSANPF